MLGTANINQMMFKCKFKAKKHKFTEMEIEVEGSLAFLTNFYKEFTESFIKNNFN